MINFFYLNKTLKDTVQSQVIFQQLFEQVVSVLLQLPPVQILYSLILMHDILTTNFEKLYFWYSKLTAEKFISNSCCVSDPAWISQKKWLLIWANLKCGHYMSSVTIKLVKKTISLRPFMHVKSVVSMNWRLNWNTNKAVTILRNPDDATIRLGHYEKKNDWHISSRYF